MDVVFLCIQTMVWLPVYEIFNMHLDVDACMEGGGGGGWVGLSKHCKRVCAES